MPAAILDRCSAPAYWTSRSALFVFDPWDHQRANMPAQRSVVVGKKLYVGNLGYQISSSELETLFAPFGTVASVQVIEDRESGRSKGFGFVEMGNDQEAQAAIQGLNGKDHDGRPLTVNEARPREERGGGGGGRGGRSGGYGGGGRGGRY
jgi:RNA recognition motif-containing protein